MKQHIPPHSEYEKQLLQHAKKHNVPCMSSATEAYVLQHLMTYKPTSCLEIGSAIGYSTSRIARTINQRSGHLVSFEISHPTYRLAMYNQRHQQLRNITLYHQNLITSPLEKLVPQPFQFVFMDAAKGEYGDYLDKILPRCGPGATIICDDILMYQNKVTSLYTSLERHSLDYTQINLEDEDALLCITVQ